MAVTSLVPTISPTVTEGKTGKAIAVEKSFDLAQAILTHPFYSVILGCALVEYLQTLTITDYTRWGWQPQPGTHAMYYGYAQKPLISSALGNTLETTAFIQGALKDLGGIQAIASLFKPGV